LRLGLLLQGQQDSDNATNKYHQHRPAATRPLPLACCCPGALPLGLNPN
jgi:hypothetical protein